MRKFLKVALVMFTLALLGGALALPAQAGDYTKGAQKFIDNMAARGIGFLENDKDAPERQRQAFRALLRDSFDMQTIGRFAIGKYWRVASAGERTEYQRLFENMIVRVYSERFASYDGQKLVTDGAKMVSDTDALVSSRIVPKDNSEPVRVDWRVRNNGGGYKIVDVVVEGVSMGVTQRSDFASVIERGGGDVAVLIKHLRM